MMYKMIDYVPVSAEYGEDMSLPEVLKIFCRLR